MLILKRVELQGFKSFPDRTEMRFPGRGIAAIVGPNGCGKSNLSDAISWVLGEQSAKCLRGSRMEDVIFAGTRDRKPLGMAQVTMVLVDPTGQVQIPGQKPSAKAATEKKANGANGNGSNGHGPAGEGAAPEAAPPGAVTLAPAAALPEKAQEITVTRRLFRSGESEYLINGKIARLRDIQELFMGTGLGPESYAIIEQGRIGQILSSKPLDRRAVIEEACGISKFKNKRRLAEAKLEGAKQNLTRVFDILEEVGRQVNSLKRQAGKAKRYEELKAELDRHLRVALAGRYLLLEREAARIGAELEAASASFAELQARAAAEGEAVTAAREEFYRLEAALTDARKRAAEARLESGASGARSRPGPRDRFDRAAPPAGRAGDREPGPARRAPGAGARTPRRAAGRAGSGRRRRPRPPGGQAAGARRVAARAVAEGSVRSRKCAAAWWRCSAKRPRSATSWRGSSPPCRRSSATGRACARTPSRRRPTWPACAPRASSSRQIADRQLQLESVQNRRAQAEKQLQESAPPPWKPAAVSEGAAPRSQLAARPPRLA